MAFIGHFIVGLSIVIPLYYFNREKFSHKIAAIFVLCNWLGPDSVQAYFFLKWDFGYFEWDFHYLIPFIIWGGILAFFYSYVSRFSVVRTKRFFRIKDDGDKTLNWRNAYLLVLSSGIIHTITDTLSRNNLKIKFIETIFEPTIFDIQSWGTDIGIQSKQLQLIAYFIMIAATFLLLFIFKQKLRDMLVYFASLIIIIVVGALAIGDGFVGGEYDIGTTVFSLVFIFAPLMMLMYVFNDVSKQPEPEETKSTGSLKQTKINGLYIVSGIILVIGGLILTLGLLGVINPDLLSSFFNFSDNVLLTLGIVFIIISALILFSGVGLLFKLKIARIIAMVGSSLLLIFLFPLAIVFYLSQDDTRKLFAKEKDASD
ncbi:MAG: hypothetical protein ACW96U_09495 [Candidatus Heimdallarchaeaceae archaeon]|jgi:hypothetical protein